MPPEGSWYQRPEPPSVPGTRLCSCSPRRRRRGAVRVRVRRRCVKKCSACARGVKMNRCRVEGAEVNHHTTNITAKQINDTKRRNTTPRRPTVVTMPRHTPVADNGLFRRGYTAGRGRQKRYECRKRGVPLSNARASRAICNAAGTAKRAPVSAKHHALRAGSRVQVEEEARC